MSRKTAPDALPLVTQAQMQKMVWLWAESCFVIWSRSWMIMAGQPGADAEARRMIMEKLQANGELAMKAMTGGLGTGGQVLDRSLDHYQTRVSANRRRLARRK